MQRFVLAVLRFCLCTWVGMAMFFVVSVVEVLDSLLTDRPPFNKFSHPTFFLPPYFGFAMTLLGTAVLSAFVGLWNARIGLLRRWVILSLVVIALGMIAFDYAFVYREIIEMFRPDVTSLRASTVVTLFQLSRLLKKGALGMSLVAAVLAIWPERPNDSPIDPTDPAL